MNYQFLVNIVHRSSLRLCPCLYECSISYSPDLEYLVILGCIDFQERTPAGCGRANLSRQDRIFDDEGGFRSSLADSR